MKKITILSILMLLLINGFAQCVSGDCENGKGEYKFKNGDTYIGQFVDGQRHGTGEIIFSHGARFIGEFSNGLPNGRGILKYSNGSKYLGFFQSGLRWGYGVKYTQENEIERCGVWRKGKLMGERTEALVLRQLGLQPGKASPYARVKITPKGVVVTDEPIKPTKTEIKKYEAAPQINITFPSNIKSRGFKVVSAKTVKVTPQNSQQEIRGTVTAKAGLKEFRVNGRPISISANGEFTTTVTLLPGKNEIYLSATDTQGKTTDRVFVLEANGKVNKPNVPTEFPTKPQDQRRLALIIGNANYVSSGVLRNPVNDVRAMEVALKGLGFDVMKYEDLDLRAMKKAINNFGNELVNYDVAMFFYAGHGLQVQGINYLVPVSANIENDQDAQYECLQTDKVLAKMDAARVKVNLVVLDACRNNPYEKTWTKSTKGGGLASITAPAGSFVAYATAPGTTASDGQGQNGLYTESLLKYINTPGATIEETFRHVRKAVLKGSQHQQVPWDSSSLVEEFFFK